MKKIIFLILCSVMSLPIYAASKIADFLKNANTIQADFIQTSVSGTKTTKTDGNFEILRPNNFKWVYVANAQEIVGNGTNIYVYDKDLAQITVRKFDSSVDKSPAFLLSGGNQVDKYYNVKTLKINDDNLAWEEVIPKDQSSNNGFRSMLIGFDTSSKIKEFRFEDEFANKVTLVLTNLRVNQKISPKEFQFKIPKGVDVLE